jgi:hypothetical protein
MAVTRAWEGTASRARRRRLIMYMRFVRVVILASTCLTLVSRDCHAFGGDPPSYEKLFKDSSLVVVVKPLTVRDATAKDKAVPQKGWEHKVTGIVTTFKVLVLVKGEYKQKKLDIVHFRLKDEFSIGNVSFLVSFPTKPEDIARIGKTDYLLFLKKNKSGQLEFVTGQVEPCYSVR